MTSKVVGEGEFMPSGGGKLKGEFVKAPFPPNNPIRKTTNADKANLMNGWTARALMPFNGGIGHFVRTSLGNGTPYVTRADRLESFARVHDSSY